MAVVSDRPGYIGALMGFPEQRPAKAIKIFSTTVTLLEELGLYVPGQRCLSIMRELKVLKGFASTVSSIGTVSKCLRHIALGDVHALDRGVNFIEELSRNMHHFDRTRNFFAGMGLISAVGYGMDKLIGDALRIALVVGSAIGLIKALKQLANQPKHWTKAHQVALGFQVLVSLSYLTQGVLHYSVTFRGIELAKTVALFAAEVIGGLGGHVHEQVHDVRVGSIRLFGE